MKRKRGGLAGLWDRNKQIIKPLATIAAGAINPALGAALGAAMGGLDRPGKSGIGLDLKGAAVGGLTGYGLGKVGQAARQGIGGLLTGTAGKAATSGAMTPAMSAASAAPAATGAATSQAPALLTGTAAPAKSWLARNAGTIAGGAQAGAQALGALAQQQANSASLDLSREQFDYQKELDDRERERQERIARLLMPLFEQQASDLARYRAPTTT